MAGSNKTVLFIAVGIFFLVVGFAAFMVFHEDLPEGQQGSGENSVPEGFTFFNVGAETQLTSSLRNSLEDTLGSDALETSTTVNLEMHFDGFLQKNFPKIHRLNQQLNDDRGQRIEHDTLKLRYRYIHKEDTPFDYVELMFYRKTQKPLYVLIRAKTSGTDIVEHLHDKYGEPQRLNWGGEQEYSHVWQKDANTLIYSSTPDRFGNPGYKIVIYFVDNISHLVQVEQRRAQPPEDRIDKTVNRAF